MCAKVFHHERCVDMEPEPVLTLHGLHEAVGDAVRQNELEVLALVVVLEIVVVGVVRHQAPMRLRPNLEEETEIEFVIVNLGVSRHAPIQVEISFLVQLFNLHRERMDLIFEYSIAHREHVTIENILSEDVVRALNDVLKDVEILSVPELSPRTFHVESRVRDEDIKVVQLREEASVGGRPELPCRDRRQVSEVNLHIS